MTTKALQARDNAGLFLDQKCGKASSNGRSRRSRSGLVEGVVNGERVLIHTNKEPLEKQIEIRIRVALNAAGVFVLKHSVEACHVCTAQPRPHTGLGKGTADLFCIVPPFGRAVFIEVKRASTRNAKRDEHQRKRAIVVRKHGAISGVATCEEEALALIAEARRPYGLLASAMRAIHGGVP